MHDPRAFFSLGPVYATGPRGACHVHGFTAPWEGVPDPLPDWDLMGTYDHFVSEGKGKLVKLSQNYTAIVNSMVACYFMSFVTKPSDFAPVLTAATGTEYTPQSLLKVGERIMALHRAYNNRCGITRAHDRLSPRQLQKTNEGGNKGFSPDVDAILDEYYTESGWDADGKPTAVTLTSLGLDFAAADLHG